MIKLAVNVAVIQDGKILLTQGEDFETWVLPSGGVKSSESLAQQTIRETKEETGLVGVYSRLDSWSPSHMILFAAKPIGGHMKPQQGETIAVEWFAFDELPSPISLGHQRRIQDAAEGMNDTVVLQEINLPAMPENLTGQGLLARYMESGLSRQGFNLQIADRAEIKEIVEVGLCDL